MPTPERQRWLTPKHCARRLRTHVSTIHRWIRTGRLKALKTPGGRYLVAPADFEAALVPAAPAQPWHAQASRTQGAAHAAALEQLRRAGIG
jgi:excisionase family DNA binding protein